jgi:hypothetical protein
MGVDGIIEEVFRLQDFWNPMEIGIESNVFQALFQKILDDEMIKRKVKLNLRGIEHSTKVNKDIRIQSLVPYIQNGQVKILKTDIELLSEFKRYPRWKDDLLDALEGAISILSPAKEVSVEFDIDKMVWKKRKDEMISKNTMKPKTDGVFHSIFSDLC